MSVAGVNALGDYLGEIMPDDSTVAVSNYLFLFDPYGSVWSMNLAIYFSEDSNLRRCNFLRSVSSNVVLVKFADLQLPFPCPSSNGQSTHTRLLIWEVCISDRKSGSACRKRGV